MNKVLIIEDDGALRTTLASALESEGFLAILASDGAEGLKKASMDGPDLVVLDLVLPSMGGLEICKRLREKGDRVPIIMLTGRKKDEIDRVLGLELGADDYMLKPFGVREFLARVRAVLRRGRGDPARIDAAAFGDVRVDFRGKTATKGGKNISLTAKEFGLLELLASHAGRWSDGTASSTRFGVMTSSRRRERSTRSSAICAGRSRTIPRSRSMS